jgi:branched-chain amino acid transport system permease protein
MSNVESSGHVESIRNRYDDLSVRQQWLLWGGVVTFMALVPTLVEMFLANQSLFVLNTLIYVFLFLILGHGWNVIGGYAGQVSLGHAVMFAVGAYGTAILYVYYGITPFVGIFVGALLAVLAGLLIGAVTFGLRYHYFAMATLAAALIVRVFFFRWDFVGGASGIEYPLDQIGTFWSLTFADKPAYYYLFGAVALVTTLFMYQLNRSRLGTYLKAVNMDQELAENAGLKAWWYKMYAMGISSLITGFGGGLYAQFLMYIDPMATLRVLRNIDILLVPVIGGTGTVLGPVIGAFVFIPVREYTRTTLSGTATGLGWVVFGVVLLLISLYRPGGILNKYTGRKSE